MALSPIQIFQSNRNPLEEILSNGNRTITGILDKAVQIGRDISNKQMRQEQDLIGMRQRETALQQRRAENLQQDWEDAFNFGRKRIEFERSAGQRDRSLDISERGMEGQLALGRDRLNLARGQAAADKANQDQLSAYFASQYTDTEGAPRPRAVTEEVPPLAPLGRETVISAAQGTPAESTVNAVAQTAESLAGPPGAPETLGGAGQNVLRTLGAAAVPGIPGMLGRAAQGASQIIQSLPEGASADEYSRSITEREAVQGRNAAAEAQVAAPPEAPADPLLDLVRQKGKLEADYSLAGKNPQMRSRIGQELAAVELQLQRAESAEKAKSTAETPAGQRAAERLEISKQKDRIAEAETRGRFLLKDTKAFVSPEIWGAKNLASQKPLAEFKVEADLYKKDPYEYEIASALRYDDPDEYADFAGMKLNDKQIKARRELWEIAHKNYGSGGTSGSSSSGGFDLSKYKQGY